MVTNGIVAQDAAQADALWAVRERITEALQHDGTVYKYDISLPLPQLYSLVCFLWCAHLFVCTCAAVGKGKSCGHCADSRCVGVKVDR